MTKIDTRTIYLDHNSTSYLNEQDTYQSLANITNIPLNASSLHQHGRYAKHLLEDARDRVKLSLHIEKKNNVNLVFTGSATEANNIVINSFKKHCILVSGIEHSSVTECKKLCDNMITVNVNKEGIIDLDHLKELLKSVHGKSNAILICTMLANNETGAIQPIKEICALAKQFGAFVHSDFVQAIGKISTDFFDLGVDSISISGHKIGTFPGIGALIFKESFPISTYTFGGGQEKNIRCGTENVFYAQYFASVLEKVTNNIEKYTLHTTKLQNHLEKSIHEISNSKAIIWSENSKRLPNTSFIMMPKVHSNIQLIKFDLNNISVSNGSACSSGTMNATSSVLNAMNASINEIESSIRVSTSYNNTIQDIHEFLSVWKEIYLQNNE